MKHLKSWLNEAADVDGLQSLQRQLNHHLIDPADALFARPHKQVRSELVRLGFLLSGDRHEKGACTQAESEAIACLGRVLETVHAGSLVVDDVQDASLLRRGEPSLHCLVGVPLAINLGNWLYFRPLEWIRALRLPEAKELALYRLYHETLSRAHLGQALDLGTRIDTVPQAEVELLCQEAMKLKTGALMALALQMGALLGDADEARIELLGRWGQGFGVGLQMCNDLMTLKPGPERFHDLSLRRPTFVWALAAWSSPPEDYAGWLEAIGKLPDPEALEHWIVSQDFLRRSCDSSREFLALIREQLAEALPADTGAFSQSFAIIDQLLQRICHAYI